MLTDEGGSLSLPCAVRNCRLGAVLPRTKVDHMPQAAIRKSLAVCLVALAGVICLAKPQAHDTPNPAPNPGADVYAKRCAARENREPCLANFCQNVGWFEIGAGR